MQSIETILKENKKYQHLWEIVYYKKPRLIAWKLIGADTAQQAIKKSRIKNIIDVIQHN